MSKNPIRQGQVYWLEECPPLDGDRSKDRPVIVVSPRPLLEAGGDVVVVAATTKPREATDPDMVKLPNRQDTARTTSGLLKPCWAIPRWFLLVRRERLKTPVGYVSGPTLRRIVVAVETRMELLRQEASEIDPPPTEE